MLWSIINYAFKTSDNWKMDSLKLMSWTSHYRKLSHRYTVISSNVKPCKRVPCKRMQHVHVFRWFSPPRHDLSPVFSISIIITSTGVTTSSVLNLLVVNPASFGSTNRKYAILLIGCAFSNTCSRFSNAARSATEVTVTKDVLTDDCFTAL